MRTKAMLKISLACAALLMLAGMGLPEAHSQQQTRRRPSRRVTNPVRPQTVPPPATDGEPALISAAEDQLDSAGQTDDGQTTSRTRRNTNRPGVEPERARQTLDRLASEVTRLNKKVDDLEKQRRSDLIQERLTRAEQRAEGLQQQQRDVLEKEANLQARADLIDEQLRPENLERQTALAGAFRPDDVREALRRQLENEKRRIQSQLDLLAANRARIESALTNADAAVQRLRTQLDEETRKELEAEGGAELNSSPPQQPSPSATPPPGK
ncbi:MAG: hypothetical protein H0T45_00235 [Pyrinomonadaceae bacterium]|nr:hypothetical protein [Pyrinomonadaceae bacterium]